MKPPSKPAGPAGRSPVEPLLAVADLHAGYGRAEVLHGLSLRAERISQTMEDAALQVLSAAERALLIELLFKVARVPRSPR